MNDNEKSREELTKIEFKARGIRNENKIDPFLEVKVNEVLRLKLVWVWKKKLGIYGFLREEVFKIEF